MRGAGTKRKTFALALLHFFGVCLCESNIFFPPHPKPEERIPFPNGPFKYSPKSAKSLLLPKQGPLRPLEPYQLSWGRTSRDAPVPVQFSEGGTAGRQIISTVAEYGLNETLYLINIKEPKLFKEGYRLVRGHPGLYLAAFNKQKMKTKDLARFGYASLKASEMLSKQFLMTRQQALFGLEQVSLKNTALYDSCPFKTDEHRQPGCPAYSVMYRTLDGSCNNLDNPEWGASFRAFARFLPPDYSDGIDTLRASVANGPLPNPRKVSSMVHRSLNSPSKKVSLMVMQWGQFLDHDLTATAQARGFNHSVPMCCQNGKPLEDSVKHPDCMPIQIPSDDYFYSQWNHTCMEFLRSSPAPRPNCALGPRDQINQVTSFLDASSVYGSDDHEMAELRLWENGMLKYKPVRFRKALLPPLEHFEEGECRENSRNLHCFQAGDLRVNEQPALASMHTIWLREHNRLVAQLAELNPHWNDDRLFFETRRIVGAFLQKITYGEWLPTVLGPTVMKLFKLPLQRYGYYRGYSASVNPTCANAFGAAAFRFGHSLVQSSLSRCDKFGRRVPFVIKLHQELMNPANIHNFGSVDRIILGMAFEKSQDRDVYITNELTRHLFQTPDHHYGMDLAAINLQRGRDHGLPAYNVWREQCGLHRFANWGELLKVMEDDTVGRLAAIYRHVDDIDLFSGGLAEKSVVYGMVGPTFACILGQQFLNLRRGDRFWFENGGFVSSFTPEQLRELRKMTLARIICNNLDDIDSIQPNVFRPPTEDGRNDKVSCTGPEIGTVDLLPWVEKIDAEFPGLQYAGMTVNLSLVTTDENMTTSDLEFPNDLESLPEDELFMLEPADELDFENPSLYSSELPRPFDSVDEKVAKEDDGASPSLRTPGGSVASMAAIMNHNFNNVIKHAYVDTLFYKKKK